MPPMRHQPRLTPHGLAAVALTIGLVCLAGEHGAWAQRGNTAGAAQGGTGGRTGGPPRDPGQGPFGGRGFGRGNQPAGSAVIRGRVTAIDTGAPVRRAQVSATAPGTGLMRAATTDADGQFELRDLPAAAWTLTASKPGFVAQRLGQRHPFESVVPLDVGDGQQVGGANFALARGGVITGRIYDDLGDPLANARVQVLRSRMVEGRRRLVAVGVSDGTDDTGAFRLYGLAPGDYYVSASMGGFIGAVGGNAVGAVAMGAVTFAAGAAEPIQLRGASGSVPTYFPGTVNVAEAQRIRLGAGEETTISFGLQAVRASRISGTVINADGGAPSSGAVMLRSADSDEVFVGMGAGGPILADGAFSIPSVAPGSYALTARTGGQNRGGSGRTAGEMEVGTVNVTVNGEDLSGVTITMTHGATLQGTIVGAGGARPALDGVRVVSRPTRAGEPMGGGNATASVSAAGAFQLYPLHGAVRLRVERLPAPWQVQSIEVNGVDVTDAGLELKGTEQITGVRITLTDRIAEVNGTVKLGAQVAKDAAVLIFADDEARWTFPSRFVRSTRGNDQGNFSVRGLPPGLGYLAAAVSYLEEGEAEDPEFLAALRDRATSVSLREGETKTIELRVIER
jgi:hypothetical protein